MIEARRNWHFWLLWLLLLAGGGFVHWRENAGDALPTRKPLRELPLSLGEWRRFGTDGEFSAEVLSVLRPDDYLLRDYFLPSNGRTANVYVGYYNTQRAGATYHSPRNCLPGSGWTMGQAEEIEIALPNNQRFLANSYTVENRGDKFLMIYWYQGRGRLVANEYKDKLLTIWDSVQRRRSDGALVRLVIPLQKTEMDSKQAALDLSAHLAENLPEFVPN